MLKGKKVYLDVIDPSNIEWMRQQRNKPEMRQYFREWKDISKDQQVKWYASRGNNTDPNHVYFEIHSAEPVALGPKKSIATNELVGSCGLHYVDWRLRSAEFGIFLCDKARGHGMGKEALTILLDYGFNTMNMNRVWAEVFDNNQAISMYKKIGFKEEGVMRDTYFESGKYGNSYIISLLQREWDA